MDDKRKKAIMKNSNLKDLLGVIVAFLAVFLLLSVLPQTSSKFLTTTNLFNVARQITVNIILACLLI